jgi:hypothetical protein
MDEAPQQLGLVQLRVCLGNQALEANGLAETYHSNVRFELFLVVCVIALQNNYVLVGHLLLQVGKLVSRLHVHNQQQLKPIHGGIFDQTLCGSFVQ